MNILMVYPDYPDTFWSFKYALKFISRKSTEPPLGLLTVAAMLPGKWEKKVIDLKVKKLLDKDIAWADFVFISAMSIQRKSSHEIIDRVHASGKPVVAGGPLFTMEYESFLNVEHLVLDEAEITLPMFLHDLEDGNPKQLYRSELKPSITETPVPAWELIDLKKYATVNIQYSRGCQFECDFCNISTLFGRRIRTKSKEQVITELDKLYEHGWRGGVFFVDDNFIGNKPKLKKNLLPALIRWQKERKNPFVFGTEASIDLADDDELLILMVMAGFDNVFIGIETPNEDSLAECNKLQNRNRNLKECVDKIQDYGLIVKGGFIVGFDNDPSTIFTRLSDFIQDSKIITAMVGILNAPRGTALFNRLTKEKRMVREVSGDNTDYSINFIPKMGNEKLVNGYRETLINIYSPKFYYDRVTAFLRDYKPFAKKKLNFEFRYVKALFKSIFFMGIIGRERVYYWRLFFWTLFRRPHLFSLAMTYAIYGFHFRKIFNLS